MVVDLVLLNVIDFDMILGMDCLTRHYATLDYREEVVMFRLPNDEEFRFRGDRNSMPQNLISAFTARKNAQKRLSRLLGCG